ncbi:MAG: HlyC/CorC family transporter [Pseudomonadales bacterium]|nr:HlyC/CorC family transporter [Pseudomonadales bacterium]MDP7145875.1 HlyC/CorC family transporter [Pseudomonadales bacterium]MDP7597402.1 HlyC/CorC family transporter [Pseudomonadales bacterium]HJN53099.1 HlyC/CorC family transporter [Pseudomonadales bacterium]
MEDSSIGAQLSAIIILIVLSAYFSGSETAMMALNRYRLRHLVGKKHGGAIRASKLLERPDRLLGVILIGNNFVNFSAASIATLIALEIFGESGIAVAPIVCTIVFLIFAEVAPKTISAVYPEKVALPSAYILQFLLWLFYPLVWLVNFITNGFLRMVGVKSAATVSDHLSTDELRTVVHERSKIGQRPQNMLLSILDLENVTVDDIMIPRSEIVGIDTDDDIKDIINLLRSSQHTRLPVFKTDIDEIYGILHLRNTTHFLTLGEVTKQALLEETQDAYFVPENTPLHTQLFNFQQEKQRIGMVVDEYGDIQGIVTLEDILEEIVGEFTTDLADTSIDINPQEDGSYLIDGGANIRAINRSLGFDLPTGGSKTFNGLITDYLETIPDANVCVSLAGYHIEIVQLNDNMIRTAKISRAESNLPGK